MACRMNHDLNRKMGFFLPPANEVRGKVMFLLASVILSNQRPPGQIPHWTETPTGQRPPWTRTPLYGKERAERILLECILVV